MADVVEDIAAEDTVGEDIDTEPDSADQTTAVAGEECSNDVVYDYMGSDGRVV